MCTKDENYCFKPKKIIRDLVHGYINLTPLDIALIDTIEFQRLKDVRQLTCQHVYPAARHTRFEHSLGVLELTRQAIKYLNRNGFIYDEESSGSDNPKLINKCLRFNAGIAALLHDVGHCPFSHMGETEFEQDSVRKTLHDKMKSNSHFDNCEDLIKKIGDKNAKDVGSVHEQLSCIVILEKYQPFLDDLKVESDENIHVDYELIIRSILGIEYKVSNVELMKSNQVKNAIIRLINSGIFDMDKLDYIIRDSFFTSIGTPLIDTQRLFKNMFFNKNYELIFKRKAIPVLQNMIDSRDGLYMYVYNHHAVILSDFINTYISRHLSHNFRKFANIIHPDKSEESIDKDLSTKYYIPKLGLVSKEHIFSTDSIVTYHRSDSDWIGLLNLINWSYKKLEGNIRSALEEQIKEKVADEQKANEIITVSNDTINDLVNKIKIVCTLINNLKKRTFLKPWWKTVFEFKNFINLHFPDDRIRKNVCQYICSNGNNGLKASEFRSQIAKHVIYITQKVLNLQGSPLLEALNSGDFFVVERSNRFLGLDAIEALEIALKENEIIGPPSDTNYKINQYYIKNLTNITPQKDYKSIYNKEGFYIFSKPYNEDESDDQKIKDHYKFIEQIFVFVASELVNNSEQQFVNLFGSHLSNKQRQENEKHSQEKMLTKFKREVFKQ